MVSIRSYGSEISLKLDRPSSTAATQEPQQVRIRFDAVVYHLVNDCLQT